MKKNLILVSLFVAILVVGHRFGFQDPVHYLSLFSVSCLFLFYFLLAEDVVSFLVVSILACFSLLVKILTLRDSETLYFLISLLVLLAVFFYYSADWKRKLKRSAEKKRLSVNEIRTLKQKLDDQEGSLRLMTRQLGEITDLYELAKELNDCLSYEKLVESLRETVFRGLAFSESWLLVFQGEADPPSVIRRFTLHPGGSIKESERQTDLSTLEKKVTLAACERKEIILLESLKEADPSWFQDKSVDFPIAIFPLVVQDKVIAVFLVGGYRAEDLPKFEVVAAQTALHVKKIKLYHTVHELSLVDGLTGVFVRRHFVERFEEELKRSIRHGFQLAVLMVDIDYFKSYNDQHGHLVGDVTLRGVAQVILNSVRRVDIVARYGGEEFAIVLPETDKKKGIEVAERIRASIARKQLRAYDEETSVTISIGVAAFPNDLGAQAVGDFRSDLIWELLKKADEALYQAKEEGRNRVVAYKGGVPW